jgi:hypothetical protein
VPAPASFDFLRYPFLHTRFRGHRHLPIATCNDTAPWLSIARRPKPTRRSYDIYLTDAERSRLEPLVPALKHGGLPAKHTGRRYQPGGYYRSFANYRPFEIYFDVDTKNFASVRSSSSYFQFLGLLEEEKSTTSLRTTRRTTARGQDA